VIDQPIRTLRDLDRLRPLEPDDVSFVAADIQATLAALDGSVPLIGFSGAPFTLASYLVEGGPTRDFVQTKRLMYAEPDLWHDLMQRLAGIVSAYLLVQVENGVHALQLFDSWAGALSVDDYRRYVQPYSALVCDFIAASGIPLIHFGTATGALLESMREAGGTTIGVDWRVPLDLVWERIGHDRGVQGNLDPIVLQAPWEVVQREAQAILDRAGGRPGHIFNTGHGLHPQTPPDQLRRLVEFVHTYTSSDDA
jgi:uroporphyrinogen decarboxylase